MESIEILKALKARGITQQAIAEKLRVTRQAVYGVINKTDTSAKIEGYIMKVINETVGLPDPEENEND